MNAGPRHSRFSSAKGSNPSFNQTERPGLVGLPTIVAQSQRMRHLLEDLEVIASSKAPVLLFGESGTGKELVARTIHELSDRAHRPFVAVNCAAFPDSLLEGEFFGHERGAFTGAVKRREGRFLAANGGTLLLDEIGDLSPSAQAKLLRVLQEGTFEPLGSDRSIQVDVRILSATHWDLEKRIESGQFREDLYYRLRVLSVCLPPLRKRREDIPGLVEAFLRHHCGGRKPPIISRAAWETLLSYPCPGNVRELQHGLEHAVVMARGREINVQHLPVEFRRWREKVAPAGESREPVPLADAVHSFERLHLVKSLRFCRGNRTRTAELLHISRKCLWEKMRSYEIRPGEFN